MIASAKSTWYVRKAAGNPEQVRCPRCNREFPWGPMFDQHPRCCSACGTLLVEWATLVVRYLIDPVLAPPVVKELIHYFDALSGPRAEQELRALMEFLGVETVL